MNCTADNKVNDQKIGKVDKVETTLGMPIRSVSDSILQDKGGEVISLKQRVREVAQGLPTIEEEFVTGEIMVQEPDSGFTGCVLSFESMAEFVGGQDSLNSFLHRNLVYPGDEQKRGIEGTVHVSFTIDEKGKVANPKIVKSVAGSVNFDNEVIRIINLMPSWKPERGGKKITCDYYLPIKFAIK